ncbi:biotin-dependent carboxyltransferase family protein [Aquimarina hainanensis]|uniref:Biotin-dependent carboxyltransferase family protein n=1 Tax=Aquimarina hainanensis TaxID=1578017 RepID=A0ABW5NGS2_9FLAO
MSVGVKIIKEGLRTTIQDKGRIGYAEFGIPKAGAMDQTSFLLANLLLNNKENDAVLEWVGIPPVLLFEVRTVICVTGGECEVLLDAKKMPMNVPFEVFEGSKLSFKNSKKGLYFFVGIKGGFKTESILNSRSFFMNITATSVLKKGDEIGCEKHLGLSTKNTKVSAPFYKRNFSVIEVFPGPEWEQLTKEQKQFLLETTFTISNVINRMAIQLIETVHNNLKSMLTSPVLPGTIQLTPAGKLIVLMRDCQTTGGYPRILQLTEMGIDVLAQKHPQSTFRFVLKNY